MRRVGAATRYRFVGCAGVSGSKPLADFASFIADEAILTRLRPTERFGRPLDNDEFIGALEAKTAVRSSRSDRRRNPILVRSS